MGDPSRRITESEYDVAEAAYAESRSLVAAEAEGDERAVEAAFALYPHHRQKTPLVAVAWKRAINCWTS